MTEPPGGISLVCPGICSRNSISEVEIRADVRFSASSYSCIPLLPPKLSFLTIGYESGWVGVDVDSSNSGGFNLESQSYDSTIVVVARNCHE